MRRINLHVIGVWLVVAVLALSPGLVMAAPAESDRFPQIISLPNGFRPEGIVTGRGTTIYAGSLANGAIYRADLRTGEGSLLFAGETGRVAVGLGYDRRTNFVYAAGGPTGRAYVYDGRSGETEGVFQLTAETTTFVNDVIVTRDAAYFTDSFRPVLYRLPLSRGGRLPEADAVEEIALGGDFEFVAGAFNSNGIEATASGKSLIVVNSTVGALYRVDPQSGEAALIDLGGGSVANGDGILLKGNTLYVVQNQLNQVAVIRLNHRLTSGEIVKLVTDPNLDIPTTIADFGRLLYVVNARFSTPPTPDTTYTIVRLPNH